jgi:hypothetical protein
VAIAITSRVLRSKVKNVNILGEKLLVKQILKEDNLYNTVQNLLVACESQLCLRVETKFSKFGMTEFYVHPFL